MRSFGALRPVSAGFALLAGCAVIAALAVPSRAGTPDPHRTGGVGTSASVESKSPSPHRKPALPERATGFLPAGAARVVPGRYIVKLKRTTSLAKMNVGAMAKSLSARFEGRPGQVYDRVLGGFSVSMSENRARRLAADPAVEYVRPVRITTPDGYESTQRDPRNWGIDRIDQRSLPLSSGYTRDDSRGRNWKLYIIDSGINRFHQEFCGGGDCRVEWGTNTTNDGYDTDTYGHGTMVAGLTAGETTGVNRFATVVAVKVAGQQAGTEDNLIEGIEWVTRNANGAHNVANISLSIPAEPTSDPVDDAVTDSIAKGIVYVASAGNDNTKACDLTPARHPAVITVSATTRSDARLGTANYGKCVDIFAPGENVYGPWKDDIGYNTESGTSFAAPLVAGAVTFLNIPNADVTPGRVRSELLANATKDKVSNPGEDSPNNLLYMGRSTRPPLCHLTARSVTRAAAKSPFLYQKFYDYAQSNTGWTGADGTYSITGVTGHNRLWIFSDTFLAPVQLNTRPRSAPFINDSILEEGGPYGFITYHGGTTSAPDSIMPQDANGDWYWSGSPNKWYTSIDNNRLQVVYQRYHRYGTGLWDWRWDGNVVATFGSSDLGHPVDVSPLPSSTGIAWGVATLDYFQAGDGYTYVYGIKDEHIGPPDDPTRVDKYLHVARIRGSDLRTGHWEYLDENGDWMSAERFAARQYDRITGAHVAVSNEFTVTHAGTRPELVTQDTTQAFSGEIMMYSTCSPSGPFGGKTRLYTTTEGGPWGEYENEDVFTYNGKVVGYEDDVDPDSVTLTVAYNVNSMNTDDVYANIQLYQPRFIKVTVERN